MLMPFLWILVVGMVFTDFNDKSMIDIVLWELKFIYMRSIWLATPKNENIYYDWRLGGLCSSGRFFALDG